MRDFSKVSTKELVFRLTNNFKIKLNKIEEVLRENIFKMDIKMDNMDMNIESDFRNVNKSVREAAVLQLEEEAEEGSAEAQFALGNYYFVIEKENSKEANNKIALKWYEKAAESKLVESEYNVACFYMNGLGTDKNEEKAFEWYEKAAEQGHVESLLCVALCYEHGMGTNKDEEKAFNILKSLEDKNNLNAIYCLGIFYENPRKADIYFANIKKALSVMLTHDSSPKGGAKKSGSLTV